MVIVIVIIKYNYAKKLAPRRSEGTNDFVVKNFMAVPYTGDRHASVPGSFFMVVALGYVTCIMPLFTEAFVCVTIDEIIVIQSCGWIDEEELL